MQPAIARYGSAQQESSLCTCSYSTSTATEVPSERLSTSELRCAAERTWSAERVNGVTPYVVRHLVRSYRYE